MIPEEGPPFIVVLVKGEWHVHQRLVMVSAGGQVHEVYLPQPDHEYDDLMAALRATEILTESLGDR